MQIPEAAEGIAAALAEVSRCYWRACDGAARAIDPEELGGGVLVDLLAEDFEAALKVEAVMARDGCTWAEARDFV